MEGHENAKGAKVKLQEYKACIVQEVNEESRELMRQALEEAEAEMREYPIPPRSPDPSPVPLTPPRCMSTRSLPITQSLPDPSPIPLTPPRADEAGAGEGGGRNV